MRYLISFFFLFVVSHFSSIFPHILSSDIYKQDAHVWAKKLVAQSQPAEIQLVANVLYLLHANALIDYKIRQFVIPITRLNQSIRSNIVNYKKTNDELKTLKTLLERLSHLIGARTVYNHQLETCLTYYNKNAQGPLLDAINELQLYGQNALNTIVETNSTALAEKLSNSAQIFDAHVQPLQTIAQIYKDFAEGSLFSHFKNNEHTHDIAALATIDELLQNNIIATHNAEYVLNTLDSSTEILLGLIASANEIYKTFYTALYNHITSETYDKEYSLTLFGITDILPSEYQTLLPAPDEVFGHILETIKLYTQSEITY